MTEYDRKNEAENIVGAYAELRDPHQFWKGEPPVGKVYYWHRQMTWYVWDPDAKTSEAARKFGLRLQKKLIGRRNLPSSVPYLHNRRLFVGWQGGIEELPPIIPDKTGLGSLFGVR